MVLGAFWSQTQYRAMQLMPWVLMFQREMPGSESVSLDYFSRWNVISLVQSIKKRHFLVSLCITATLLIYALTVFSTGLFELRAVWIGNSGHFTITHAFDGADFNPESVDIRPFATCLGVDSFNLSSPLGTAPSHIFSPFQLSSKPSNNNQTLDEDYEYETDVDVLTASIGCQPSNVDVDVKNDTLVFESDGCAVKVTKGSGAYFDDSYSHYGLFVGLFGCEGPDSLQPGKFPVQSGGIPPYQETDWRIWVVSARRSTLMNPSFVPLDSVNFTAFMCKAKYSMQHGPVQIGRRFGDNSISASIDPEKLNDRDPIPGVASDSFTYAAYRSMVTTETTAYDTEQRFLYRSNETLKTLWDSPEFMSTIEDSMTCTALQVARSHLLVPSEKEAEGIVRSIENRLFVRELSLGFMVGILGLLLVITGLLLFFYIPVAVCPRDTGSIGGMATIFAQSSAFMSAFNGMELKRNSEMKALLSEQKFSSRLKMDGRFVVEMSGEMNPTSRSTHGESELRWWRPFSSTVAMRIFTILTPLALIAALEALYRHSHDSGAIGIVEGKSQYIRYVWVYLPALTMFGVRLLFQSMEFGARITQPYYRLRQGGASPEVSILENQNRNIGVYAVFDTLRKGQWALAAATVSLFLASVLPVVVSGLYVVQEPNLTVPVNITQLDRWNIGEPQIDLSDNGMYHRKGASNAGYQEDMLSSMIIYLNLSYPKWTYEDLAFPKFTIPPSAGYDNDTRGFLDARLPALRSKFDCEEVSITDNCDVFWIQETNTESGLRVNCTELVERCDFVALATLSSEEGVYFAAASEGYGGDASSCPTHIFLYGQWIESRRSADMTLLACKSWIEEVDVDVSLQLPSYEFDLENPPKVVPGSHRKIFDGYLNDKAVSKPLPRQSNMIQYLLNVTSMDLDKNTVDLGVATQAAIYGINGIPAKELFYSPEKLIESINRVYGIVVAQLLNSWAHEPFQNEINPKTIVYPKTREAPIIEASFYDRRDYLVQSAMSTRILEGVLGGMVVCAILTMCLMRTRRVLPKDPCSIAAAASLLHNSRMLGRDIIPEGAEWCDDKELKKRGIFQGRTFTMGWWDGGIIRRRTVKKRGTMDYAPRLSDGGIGGDREGLLDEVVLELDRRGTGSDSHRMNSVDSGLGNDGDLGRGGVLNGRDANLGHDGYDGGRYAKAPTNDKHDSIGDDAVEEVVHDKRFGIDVDLD